jgi:hypothetical protein
MRFVVGVLFCLSLAAAETVERWCVYQVTLSGPSATFLSESQKHFLETSPRSG